MESIKGQAISQTSEILPLFALPYVTSPDKHASFQDLFSVRRDFDSKKKLCRFVERLADSIEKKIIEFFRLGFLQSTITSSR